MHVSMHTNNRSWTGSSVRLIKRPGPSCIHAHSRKKHSVYSRGQLFKNASHQWNKNRRQVYFRGLAIVWRGGFLWLVPMDMDIFLVAVRCRRRRHRLSSNERCGTMYSSVLYRSLAHIWTSVEQPDERLRILLTVLHVNMAYKTLKMLLNMVVYRKKQISATLI